ncbi:SAM-dependent methyltransferase [Nocardia sp. ET3-3]|uniref:S-adenosyl-L-methionine-dependent methyltransferase n=1 Tax=Nocardia terrae TaxID=2675851 RepID=A0A7K1UN65_9NOCA|nr:class I SAM-dependent methyltransferase [Nocardia terrae]MVU75793.1 SAM-dependent methyltransferase [Nocardia terrae]
MEIGRASRTALATAYARAYHQFSDEPRIFTDPLAVRILGVSPDQLDELGAATLDQPGSNDPRRRGRRYFLAARARYAEDVVARAVAAGSRQVVILGAGLDTFGYRNPYPGVRVFEVDHPDTQAWKRGMLADSGIEIPDSVTFTPVDFETGTLAAGLDTAGFRRDEPAAFVWLGVVMYLTKDAIVDTLRFIAAQAEPVQVVADYLSPGTTAEEREELRKRAERLASLNEPFLSYLDPGELGELLRSIGFDAVEQWTLPELIHQYVGGSPIPELAAGSALVRIMCASRGEGLKID